MYKYYLSTTVCFPIINLRFHASFFLLTNNALISISFSNIHHLNNYLSKSQRSNNNLAATLVGFDLLRAQRNAAFSGLSSRCGGLRFHSRLDLTGHGEKGLLDVFRRLGGRFQKLDPE